MSMFNSHAVRVAAFSFIGVGIALSSGCRNSPGGATAVNTGKPTVGSRPDPEKFNPTGASLCLQQMIQSTGGPFHLSFAESSENKSTIVEGDVTPAKISYTKRETTAGETSTSSNEVARAQLSEMELDFDVMGPVPWHGELVAAQDSARATGTEDVNGYHALKYTIDTANEAAAQKATFDSLMAVKDYKIAGNAWVTTDTGCLVKYSIDFEKDGKDGSVEKNHFDGNVEKK